MIASQDRWIPFFGISNWKKPLPWFSATSTNCSWLQTLDLLKTMYSLLCTSYVIETPFINLVTLVCSGFDFIISSKCLVPQHWKQELSRWAPISCKCHGKTLFPQVKLIDLTMLSPSSVGVTQVANEWG